MRKLMFALCFAVAILLTGSWFDLSHAQKTAKVPAAAKQELLKAAKAHGVKIKADKIAYVDNQKVTIVRAPIVGVDKYSEADFEKGAPIELMIIKSKTKLEVPDGSYVVKVLYERNATSGKTIFTDSAGAKVAQQDRGRPVLTLPDSPIFDDGHGEAPEIDNCALFREMFPPVCAECACSYYTQGISQDSGMTSEAREINAFVAALNRGRFCARSTPLACR